MVGERSMWGEVVPKGAVDRMEVSMPVAGVSNDDG